MAVHRFRWRIVALVALVAGAAALGGARWARSQQPFPEGAFVLAQDGTRWVVSGGIRYRIAFTADDANALPMLPEGPPVSSLRDVPLAPPAVGPGAPPPPAATTPGLTADYQFFDSLGSSAGGAPDLLTLGPTMFAQERADGPPRTVLTFAEGSGLRLSPAGSAIPSSSYSIVLLFRLNTVEGYRRILDFKDGKSDRGMYAYYGDLVFYGKEEGGGKPLKSNQYHQVVVTRDSAGTVVGYVDGARQIIFQDSEGDAVISPDNVLRFFRDDGSEHSAGAVARIRLFDRPLSADEVATLDRLP
jgi:hypothetical protein